MAASRSAPGGIAACPLQGCRVSGIWRRIHNPKTATTAPIANGRRQPQASMAEAPSTSASTATVADPKLKPKSPPAVARLANKPWRPGWAASVA